MKKSLYMAAAAAFAITGLASCGGNKSCGHDCAGHGHDKDKTEIYSGVLPAADCDGVRYMLTLEFDHDDNFMKGDYELMQTYLTNDTTAVGGLRDGKTFRSEGDFTVNTTNGQKYLKLVADKHGGDSPLYFLVDNDSTLTMVNADLQRSETPGLNYSLNLSK